jgi:hypothetical protein
VPPGELPARRSAPRIGSPVVDLMAPGSDRSPHDPASLPAPTRDERLAALRADLARRLRPLCSAMPDVEFDALMRQMAERQLRYELREEV